MDAFLSLYCWSTRYKSACYPKYFIRDKGGRRTHPRGQVGISSKQISQQASSKSADAELGTLVSLILTLISIPLLPDVSVVNGMMASSVILLRVVCWFWGAARVTAAMAERTANTLVFILRDETIER